MAWVEIVAEKHFEWLVGKPETDSLGHAEIGDGREFCVKREVYGSG